MKILLMTVCVLAIVSSHVAHASEVHPVPGLADKALLVRAAPGPNGVQFQVDAVDRSKIDEQLFIDMIATRNANPPATFMGVNPWKLYDASG